MHMQEMMLLGLIRDLLRNSLPALADPEYQRRVWFHCEGPEVDTYIDSISHFLTICDSVFRQAQGPEYLGMENYSLLKRLYGLLHAHADSVESHMDLDTLTEEKLMEDPQWHEILALSKELQYKLTEFVQGKDHG